jgi:hypothetical protein
MIIVCFVVSVCFQTAVIRKQKEDFNKKIKETFPLATLKMSHNSNDPRHAFRLAALKTGKIDYCASSFLVRCFFIHKQALFLAQMSMKTIPANSSESMSRVLRDSRPWSLLRGAFVLICIAR